MKSIDTKQTRTLRDRIRHFTPSWFALVMGTGVLSSLILNIPYGAPDARWWAAFVFFALNATLFFVFLTMSIMRYILFPEIWSLMLHHPVQSLFLACFPMGFATLINASLSLFYTNHALGGLRFLETVWALWWIDAVLSVACAVLLTYVMITRHDHSVETLNATWMLPIVAPIVASSAGGLLAYAWSTVDPYRALVTVMVSLTMVIMGLSLALMMATIYLSRLITHGFPAVGLIVSVLLPIGPCGQGGYAMLLIGKTLASVLPALSGSAASSSFLSYPATGEVLQTIAVTFAFGLWAIGTWWATTAVIGLTEVARRQHIPFRVNFWGVIFPSGVYALLTLSLGETLHSDFFSILGTTLSGVVIFAWGTITLKTIIGTIDGDIFHAPCLDDITLSVAWTTNPQENSTNPPNISTSMEMRVPSRSVHTIESRLDQSEV